MLEMDTLFPMEKNLVNGFTYTDRFLSPDEHKSLLDYVQTFTLHAFLFQGYEAKRKVASFGYDYNFENRKLKNGSPIPDGFIPLIGKVAAEIGIASNQFAELLVTEYPVDSVINWHRDAPPFDIIAGISLGADCIFKLRPHEKEKQGRKNVISLSIVPGSLYILQGEAREHWEHSIAPVKQKRFSITLRTLRK
jgi:alkylated DNA repair dioxygenase AlkB